MPPRKNKDQGGSKMPSWSPQGYRRYFKAYSGCWGLKNTLCPIKNPHTGQKCFKINPKAEMQGCKTCQMVLQ